MNKSTARNTRKVSNTASTATFFARLASQGARAAILVAVTAFTALSLAVGGCGGGGQGAASSSVASTKAANGRTLVTVHWPALPTKARTSSRATGTRLVPEAANLIILDVYRTVNGVQTLVGSGESLRPASGTTSTIEVDNLPIDTLMAVATAYPNTDSANPGTAVAEGSVLVTTIDGQLVTFTLTMASTIDHIDLSPVNPTLALGATITLSATAYDGPNESTADVVMLSPDQLQWTSSNTALATVDATGDVTAIAGGYPILTVEDSESTKTASTTVTIPLVVTISPAAPVVSVGYSTTLAATVAGAANQTVTWSVVEAGGGSVTPGGVYTAPSTSGTYHITATSQANPAYSATVPVVVQSGNAIGTIQ